jgi:asparagine synthase (glutamine-hydrolysing)
MCGIVGIVSLKSESENFVMATKMASKIRHRGPDGQRVFSHNITALGHVRLSIIDVESGAQPMLDKQTGLTIVFNGEIYNYQEIREELIGKGYHFETNSDTEVILKGYHAFGKKIVVKLNGIFAFAIYDKKSEEIFLARDHFGTKPLHYFHKNGLFLFASEQKAILEHPDVEAKLNKQTLHYHFNLRYSPGVNTLFEGIKRLPPACYMYYKNGQIEIKKYWDKIPEINYEMTKEEAIEGFHFHTKQAVKRQLVSDVPIGVYLSGGLDSSTIVQKMHELGVSNINTFTLGFNEPSDEFNEAKQVSDMFGTNHHELSLTMNPLSEMNKVIWHAEEPKINLLQGYNMSRFVKNQVKVVLGGLGGDELFAGYDLHHYVYPYRNLHSKVPKWFQKIMQFKSTLIFKMQQGIGAMKLDEYRRGAQMLLSIGNIEKFYLIIRNVWDYDNGFYKNVYSKNYLNYLKENNSTTSINFDSFFDEVSHLNPMEQVLHVERKTKMINDYLLVEDRMSMANGIEERVPYLDIDLVNYANTIPANLKIKKGTTKALFREAMTGKLPDIVINKPKWGFTVNPYLQFKKDLKMRVEAELTEKYIKEQGIFNYDYIHKIVNHPAHPKLRWHYNHLWLILGYKVWEEEFGVTS